MRPHLSTPSPFAPAPLHLLLVLAVIATGSLTVLARPAAAAPGDAKCITYEFHYTDDDADGGELCTTGGVGSIMNVTSGNDPDLHVNSLHISCSDDFDVPVLGEDEQLMGYDSSGDSDLAGHLVAPHPDTGEPWFSITKSWADDCTTSPVATFSLSIDKQISVDGGATWLDADDPTSTDTPSVLEGDTVDYLITVTNTGTGDLTAVTVDDNVYDDCDTTIAALPVTDPIWTCTYSATAGASALENTATATQADHELSDANDANYTVREPEPEPVHGLTLTKHVSADGGATWTSGEEGDDDNGTATAGVPTVDEGDTVHFRITVTSTDDPLSAVHLDDDLYDLGAVSLDAASDCAGATAVDGDLDVGTLDGAWTCVFSVTAGAPGTYTNTATASSLEEQTDDASDVAAFTVATPPPPPPPPPPANPAIDVVKTASTDVADIGETVTYTYVITNTGDVTLTDVTAVDDRLGALTLGTTTLEPGASTEGVATYVPTEDDLPGPIVNVVVATGTPPEGADVSATDDATVALTSAPAISLVKTADVEPDIEGNKVVAYEPNDGDDETVGYTYVVTNTGDVTLENVTLFDDVLGDIELAVTTLAPGESTTASATHLVTQADADAGAIANTADVSGTPPVGPDVTDTDDELVFVTVVLPLILERDPDPAPDPIAPLELPRTGIDTDALAVLAFSMLALGVMLVRVPRRAEARTRRGS